MHVFEFADGNHLARSPQARTELIAANTFPVPNLFSSKRRPAGRIRSGKSRSWSSTFAARVHPPKEKIERWRIKYMYSRLARSASAGCYTETGGERGATKGWWMAGAVNTIGQSKRGGGDRSSRPALLQARENEQKAPSLWIKGATFQQIAAAGFGIATASGRRDCRVSICRRSWRSRISTAAFRWRVSGGCWSGWTRRPWSLDGTLPSKGLPSALLPETPTLKEPKISTPVALKVIALPPFF